MTFQALLFCQDEKTARITTQVLNELEFGVEICSEPFAAVKKLMGGHFDAIVVDCDNEQNATLLFKSARNSQSNQAALAVAVVEGQAGVANAFRIGANLVLTKPINVEQAKGTLRVARGLLKKAADSGKPSVTAASPASAAPSVPLPTPSAAKLEIAQPEPARVAPQPVQLPKSPVPVATTKPVVEPASTRAIDDEAEEESIAASDPAEEILLEALEEHEASLAASEPAQDKAASSKGQSLPPKPALPSYLNVPKPTPAVSKPAPGIAGFPAIAATSAASAPAPAKETLKPASILAAKEAHAESAPAPSAPIQPKSAANPSQVAAPTFAALDAKTGESSGAGKKILIVMLVLAALASAAYFGYTKFYKQGPGNSPSETPTQAQPLPVSSNTPESVPPAASAQASMVVTATKPAETSPTSHASASTKAAADEPEVVVIKPATPVTVVKSDLHKSKGGNAEASAEVQAPPVLGTSGSADDTALNSIVSSAPASVPKIAPQQVLKVSQGVTQGLLLKRVQPVYPHQALQMHVEGSVQLLAMITKSGSISSVKVISGDPVLARAAVDAVSQWKYKPYYLDSEPVDIQTQITVNFKLP